MKKTIYFIASLILFLGIAQTAQAYECDISVLNAINDKQIVDYNPVTKVWSRNLGLKDYVFTKHTTIGTGSYTEFVFKDKTFDTNTTYEFISEGRLIGYSHHLMKFFQLEFDNNEFKTRELTKEEVQEFFPDVEIIMISEFKDNEIEKELPIFHKKAFMLLNDTDRDFYKYQFEYFNNRNMFNNIFEVRMPRILVYSHFKSRDKMFPILKIKIKPLFHFEVDDSYYEQ